MTKKKRIIGFAGRMRSGKGMLTDAICQNEKKTVRLAFANYLKYLCLDLLNVDWQTLIHYKNCNYPILANPDERWYKIISKRTGIPYDKVKEELGTTIIPNVRTLLQVLGTDIIRKYNQDWHVNELKKEVETYGDDYIIIVEDVRFPNECEAITNMGGDVFFVIRPNNFNVSNHISETSLKWNHFPYDNVIINQYPEKAVKTYFYQAFVNGFTMNNQNPLFLSGNIEYTWGCNINFPRSSTQNKLAEEILKQNVKNPAFIYNGTITFHTQDNKMLESFYEDLLLTQKGTLHTFSLYNPLINENLKFLLNGNLE